MTTARGPSRPRNSITSRAAHHMQDIVNVYVFLWHAVHFIDVGDFASGRTFKT